MTAYRKIQRPFSTASGSGVTPQHRLCSLDGQPPLGALRAWFLASGSKLEADSRRGVPSRVWALVLPTKLLRRNSSDEGRPERGKRIEHVGKEDWGDPRDTAEHDGGSHGDPNRQGVEGGND